MCVMNMRVNVLQRYVCIDVCVYVDVCVNVVWDLVLVLRLRPQTWTIYCHTYILGSMQLT